MNVRLTAIAQRYLKLASDGRTANATILAALKREAVEVVRRQEWEKIVEHAERSTQ
jgi:hypothetical protein